MRPSRSIAGAKAKASGDAFEDRLQTQHDIYALTGVCYVVPVPPPVQVIRRLHGGQFVGCFNASGPADYAAIVRGTAIVFDAKSTAAKSWGFDGLAEHQAQHFDRAQAAGGYSFILLSMLGEVWLLPWLAIGPLWWAWWKNPGRAKAGTASLSVNDVAHLGHLVRGVDWMLALTSAMEAEL